MYFREDVIQLTDEDLIMNEIFDQITDKIPTNLDCIFNTQVNTIVFSYNKQALVQIFVKDEHIVFQIANYKLFRNIDQQSWRYLIQLQKHLVNLT